MNIPKKIYINSCQFTLDGLSRRLNTTEIEYVLPIVNSGWLSVKSSPPISNRNDGRQVLAAYVIEGEMNVSTLIFWHSQFFPIEQWEEFYMDGCIRDTNPMENVIYWQPLPNDPILAV